VLRVPVETLPDSGYAYIREGGKMTFET